MAFCPGCGTEYPEGRIFCPNCGAMMQVGGVTINVSGANAQEVQAVASALYDKAKQDKNVSPWLSGSFYLTAFIVVVAMFLTAGKVLPLVTLPLVLIGGIIAFSIVGAFILRQDDRLAEKGFLDLMKLSFKYLPLLRKRDSKKRRDG